MRVIDAESCDEYEREAAVAVRQFTAVKSALPHCMGISYGVERQKLFALGFAPSQNATSHRLHLGKAA